MDSTYSPGAHVVVEPDREAFLVPLPVPVGSPGWAGFEVLLGETAGEPKELRKVRRLRQAVYGLPYPVDVWVMGEQEFEETKNVIGGLAYPAQKYGVVLHENA